MERTSPAQQGLSGNGRSDGRDDQDWTPALDGHGTEEQRRKVDVVDVVNPPAPVRRCTAVAAAWKELLEDLLHRRGLWNVRCCKVEYG